MYQPMKKSILSGVLLTMICLSTSVFANISNELPVKFLRFYVNVEGDNVRIRWTTDSEYDNDFFTVERSVDMVNWENLENVPGAGTSPGAGEYEYYDTEPKQGVNYYRIRQTDLNQAFDFTHIEKIEFDYDMVNDIADVAIAPNPLPGSTDSFIVNGEKSLLGATIKLIDITGKEIRSQIDVNDTEARVTPFQKIPGLYFLTIQKGKHSIVKKIKIE